MRRGDFTRIENPRFDSQTAEREFRKRFREAPNPAICGEIERGIGAWIGQGDAQFWRSPLYLALVADAQKLGLCSPAFRPMWWLRVWRHDGARIRNHWSELQDIKAQLIGAENEAVEIYPPAAFVQDGENSYHLWAFKDPGPLLPFGFRRPGNGGAGAGFKAVSLRHIVEASPEAVAS